MVWSSLEESLIRHLLFRQSFTDISGVVLVEKPSVSLSMPLCLCHPLSPSVSLSFLYLSAHRVVLAAGGDYFRALLCGGLRESTEDVVCLRGVAPRVIESILCFIYTGQLRLGWSQIWELTDALFQFQLQGPLSLCIDFLRERMDESTCLDVLVLAETYGLVQLGQAAEEYILAHFQSVSAGEKFKDVPCSLLAKLLEKDSLCVESEVIFFISVCLNNCRLGEFGKRRPSQ